MIEALRIKLQDSQSASNVFFDTNWRISKANSTYRLYAAHDFKSIPEGGDPLGLIAHLVTRARLENSGVTQIEVASHRVYVHYSPALAPGKAEQLTRAALSTAALQHQYV